MTLGTLKMHGFTLTSADALHDNVRFWDSMCQFHEAVARDPPEDDSGLRAIRCIRSVLEANWSQEPAARHPLIQRLGWASTQNNAWLDLYARKLRAVTRIPGFPMVLPRLGHPSEYLGAFAEVEVALKLSLSGFSVSFVPRSGDPTPDLLAVCDSSALNVEMSYLNPPLQEGLIQQLFTQILVEGMKAKVTVGGTIGRAPSERELTEFTAKVQAAAEQAKSERRVVRANKPGLAIVYVAPRELIDDMPPDSRGSFRMVQPTRWPVEVQIARKLKEKAAALSQGGRSGLLVLYSWMIDADGAIALFEAAGDDVGPALASYPDIVGLVLTVPMRFQPQAMDEPTRRNEDRTLLIRRSSTDERECMVVWKNPHADEPLPEAVIAALEAYPSRVLGLPPLE